MSLDTPALSIRPMCRESLDDFRALLGAPPDGWCWCVAWEVETWDGWGDRTAEANRALREELWRKGEFHGYLLYDDGVPVAWCRVGPRRTWAKLCRQYALDPSEEVHAFTCFGMREGRRGKGLMHAFMALVLASLASRGVRRVEGFPRRLLGEVEPGEVWTGPLGLYRRAGFEVVREHPRSYHVARSLAEAGPTSSSAASA